MRKELFTPLRFYTALTKKHSNRKFYKSDGIDYNLNAPKTSFLPFCFLRDPSSSEISTINVKNLSTGATDFTLATVSAVSPYISVYQVRDASNTVTDDIVTYKGDTISGMDLSEGVYYLEVHDEGSNIFYSEDFCVVNDTCEYIRISWLNSTDIDYFPYSKGFFHHCYVDSDLIEEVPEYQTEELSLGDLTTVETFRSCTKRYHLSVDAVPPYLNDALSLIKLHDTVTLSKPDLPIHIDDAELKNINYEGEWATRLAFNGKLTFRIDTVYTGVSADDLTLTDL